MARRALYAVIVGGNNITSEIDPLLEQLSVTDKAGTTSDTASIDLTDSDGRILMPDKGDPVIIQLGWEGGGVSQVFEGTVDEIRSRGTRGGGTTLHIGAKGFDTGAKAKEPLDLHKDDASLQDFMSEAAGKAGLSFEAIGSIGGLQRQYWAAGAESFIHLGHRVAREVGGIFKIVGNRAVMVGMGEGLSIDGAGVGSVTCSFGPGGNGEQWDISPILSRPRFEETRVRWYDQKAAKWKDEKLQVEIPGGGGSARHTGRQVRSDSGEARQGATSHKKRSEREAGSGSVTMLGEPGAQPEGLCLVTGARPGIDGAYRIESVHHELSRGSGFRTKLDLKQPGEGTGADSRDAD